MVPHPRPHRRLSHSPLGLVTVDLAVGLLAFVLWRLWAQAPVRDLVPRVVGERLPQPGWPGATCRGRPSRWCWGRSRTSSGTRSPMPAGGASTWCRGCTPSTSACPAGRGPSTSAACSGCSARWCGAWRLARTDPTRTACGARPRTAVGLGARGGRRPGRQRRRCGPVPGSPEESLYGAVTFGGSALGVAVAVAWRPLVGAEPTATSSALGEPCDPAPPEETPE